VQRTSWEFHGPVSPDDVNLGELYNGDQGWRVTSVRIVGVVGAGPEAADAAPQAAEPHKLPIALRKTVVSLACMLLGSAVGVAWFTSCRVTALEPWRLPCLTGTT
jgi:hypothetical protein